MCLPYNHRPVEGSVSQDSLKLVLIVGTLVGRRPGVSPYASPKAAAVAQPEYQSFPDITLACLTLGVPPLSALQHVQLISNPLGWVRTGQGCHDRNGQPYK